MAIDATHDPETTQVIRGACPHDCPDCCATLVTVERGRATKIQGDPNHPFTQGFLCAKVNRYLERTYHKDRLTTPLRRVGPKGSGKFEPATWEEALTDIAAKLNVIRASSDGPQAILPYSYAGTMGYVQAESMDRRFFHAIGASKLDRTICSTAGAVGMQMTVGANVGADGEGLPWSDLVLLWGTNTLTANPHLWPHVLKARENGATIIAIDPIRTRTAEQCDEWIGIRPGTDAALALAMMHVIFAEGLEDADYIEQYTLGGDQLRERVKEWSPARAAPLTGIPEETIISLARRYGRAKSAFLRINYGLQRHGGGGMAVRTLACLPAVCGHWRRPGGGIQLSMSKSFQFNKDALMRPDLLPGPVRTINMIRLGDALNTADAGVGGPPVKAIVVYNSNPAAVAPDRNAVVRGLSREDLFTVVLEHFQTDTADWADWLLPATTQLEHWDVHFSYGHLYASLNRPAIAPMGEAKPNSEIFRLLAAKMGLDHPALREDDLSIIRGALDTTSPIMKTVTLDSLMDKGWVRLNVPTPHVPFAEGNFPTPSGKCEFYSERLKAQGMDPLPTFTPPHEFPETTPELAARFPLNLISSPRHQFLNSTFVNVDSLRRDASPEIVLNTADAAVRSIVDGARVVVGNDRGFFTGIARVNDSVREGVANAPSIWWTKLASDGKNANDTTSQLETDMGHGPVFYDNLVEIRVAD
ncbi:MAG: molybdopterin oxidoreductase family protein [Gemmatimonadetes bacterium]|nr:molybdopterin oxidoreductase family protein [Gemmatimonadota bacterium]